MDPLEAVFLFCFVFGAAMSALSFLLGTLSLPGFGSDGGDPGTGGDAPAGIEPVDVSDPGAGDSGPAEHPTRQAPSPVNVNTATAFLAFFGGIGYILYGALGAAAALAMIGATVAGLVGGALIHLFLLKVLLKGQRFLDPADSRMESTVGQVTRPIRPDGIGEIMYSRDGSRRSEGARSATGEPIAQGTEVVIVRYEKGLAYVEPWASYARES